MVLLIQLPPVDLPRKLKITPSVHVLQQIINISKHEK